MIYTPPVVPPEAGGDGRLPPLLRGGLEGGYVCCFRVYCCRCRGFFSLLVQLLLPFIVGVGENLEGQFWIPALELGEKVIKEYDQVV